MPVTQQKENLVRKQVMLSLGNIEKLEAIASSNSSSVAEVVRLAIDNYSPYEQQDSDLMELVAARLEEAVKDTAKTRKRLSKALTALDLEDKKNGKLD